MAPQPLTLQDLEQALQDGAVAIRTRTRLEPAGGPGDKVFPPTFGDAIEVRLSDNERHKTRYAMEQRRIEGVDVWCVLLDSVASQANRLEEALQRAWDEGRLHFPLVRVNFTSATDEDPALDLSAIGGDGYLTSLEAPHRLADALLRDSMLGDLRFRASKPGRAFTEASPQNATAVYALSPNALVFGMWDSTGPKGGQGSKFQRALVSEIVGVGVVPGRKTASRIDPAGIELNAGPVYTAADEAEEWTVHENDAAIVKGTPELFSRKRSDKAGKPSSINHGNVKPSIDSEAGGVTVDYALQTIVLSLPVLRRLRFPRAVDGDRHDADHRRGAENAARTALAALALAAVSFQRAEGYDLRSRCAFVPDGPLELEVVSRNGDEVGRFSLPVDAAAELLKAAHAAAEKVGMAWAVEPIDLVPAPKLVELIRRSRRVAATEDAEDEEG
jgi:CRISPR-associated protein Csb1